MKQISFVLACFLAYSLSLANLKAQSVDEILDNYFENTGGIENWKSLKSMKQTGKVLQMGMELPFTILSKADKNQYKLVVDVQGKTLIPQAYDGETAWSLNPFQMQTEPTRMPEEQAKLMEEEAEFESPFINYAEKGYKVELEGKETIEGTECFKVKLTKKEGSVSHYFFDTENYVPIMIRSAVRIGPNKGQYTETFMSDYQEAGDFMMPYAIVTKVGGQDVANIVIETIEVNVEIEDSEFAFKKE